MRGFTILISNEKNKVSTTLGYFFKIESPDFSENSAEAGNIFTALLSLMLWVFSTSAKQSHMPQTGCAICILKVLVRSLVCIPSIVLGICSREGDWIHISNEVFSCTVPLPSWTLLTPSLLAFQAFQQRRQSPTGKQPDLLSTTLPSPYRVSLLWGTLRSLVGKQHMMINNATTYHKTGPTSSVARKKIPVFRTPRSPAGHMNIAVRGPEHVAIWQPQSTSPLPAINCAASPYQGTVDRFSNNSANFPLTVFPCFFGGKGRTTEIKRPWELNTGCWLSVKKTRHIYRGAEVRLPRQTLFSCFGTSLLKIA